MSIAAHWNHTARLYRTTQTRGGFGTTDTLSPVGAAPSKPNARPDIAWSGDQQHAGGEQQGAKRRWFVDRAIDVHERDVLAVMTGPEAPMTVRVVSVTKAVGRTHSHTEVNVESWTGTLPA
jgi:hypothetical protein